jgi:hypothetical protein
MYLWIPVLLIAVPVHLLSSYYRSPLPTVSGTVKLLEYYYHIINKNIFTRKSSGGHQAKTRKEEKPKTKAAILILLVVD